MKPSNIHREHGTVASFWCLDGALDELKLYNRARAPKEVAMALANVAPVADCEIQDIRGYERPGACNHWPVGQARCDGRTVQAEGQKVRSRVWGSETLPFQKRLLTDLKKRRRKLRVTHSWRGRTRSMSAARI